MLSMNPGSRAPQTRLMALLAAMLLCGMAETALGQAPPFFGGGVAAYDPEVSIIQSGTLLDTQAVVSADRKYVTLNMRATRSGLKSLATFPVVAGPPQGFVGGAAFPNNAAAAAPADAAGSTAQTRGAAPGRGAAPVPPSADAVRLDDRSAPLTRQGMFLVRPLD